jgi:DNA-binding CsgD family transcriptional regulator
MPSRFQEMLRTQRQNAETARAGLMWESDEEDRMLNMILGGKSMADTAKELQRTEGSIQTRVYSIYLNKIDNGDETFQSVYDKLGITSEELEDFREKKKQRDEKLQQRLKTKKPGRKPLNNNRPARSDASDISDQLYDIKRDLDSIKRYFKIA